ncbi:MAG: GNAT family N-acetyltransferase [Thermoplasmata archaeon]
MRDDPVETPRRTTAATREELEELLQMIRRELLLRAELPTGEWVEESASELRSGAKPGWYLPRESGGGLAFFARRGTAAYGHVHAGEGDAADARAHRLATTLLDALPREISSIDLGFTGLSPTAERSVAGRLAARPGSLVIERHAMERELSAADGERLTESPGTARLVPIRSVTLDALVDLDWKAFHGSVDGLVLGSGIDEYRRVLQSMLDGRVGRFLDEASIALVETDPVRLVGAIMTTEQSARRAVFVDLMVDPERQRRGLARFLMRWGFRALWAFGYERVRLWVTAANRPARNLYESLGFRTMAEATIYRWDREASAPQAQSTL